MDKTVINIGHAPIMISFNDAKETPDEVCDIMNRYITHSGF